MQKPDLGVQATLNCDNMFRERCLCFYLNQIRWRNCSLVMKSKTWMSQARCLDQGIVETVKDLRLPGEARGLERLIIGRREWVWLPEFAARPMVAKVDTGARTSCLHAEDLQASADGQWVSFRTFDAGMRQDVQCCRIIARKVIRNSCGVAETRYVIRTRALFSGGLTLTLDLTLADRREMKCPMLLGRRAIAGFFVVDPQANYLLGKRHEF